MSECIIDYFILNADVKSSADFDDLLVNGGRSIYEVVRLMDGVPLFLEYHFERFKNSASLIDSPMILSYVQIQDYIHKLIEANGVNVGNVKIVFNYSDAGEKFMFYFIEHNYPSREDYEKGVDTVLFHAERSNPNAKVINSQLREQVNKTLKEEKAYEALLVDRNGYITEGSKSNVFIVKADKVMTSPLKAVLPGVTRGIIIELLKKLNIDIIEEEIDYRELESFHGLFLTGTSPKVLPIRKVGDHDFNSSTNVLIKRIMDAYEKSINNYIKNNDNKK